LLAMLAASENQLPTTLAPKKKADSE
jgi:hypothetical protein